MNDNGLSDSDFHYFAASSLLFLCVFGALVFEGYAPVLIPIGVVLMGAYLAIAHFVFKI